MADSSTPNNADASDGMTLISPKNTEPKPALKETVLVEKRSTAADEMTQMQSPPTQLNVKPGDDKTVIHTPAPGSRQPAPGSKQPSSSGISGSSSFSNTGRKVALSVKEQDLSEEGLLQQAPRIDFNGRRVPSLGGIPLISKLGQGGMGAVYYGIHPGLQIEVAVKVLPLALAQPEAIQRFYREAQIAAKIQSPHLVAVRDVNQEHGLYYLVMEYINGMTAGGYLKEIKHQNQPGLSEAAALDIIIAASEGLAVAHGAAIIHRDIKPDNILIPRFVGKQELDFSNSRLSDLGLARQEQGEGLTVTAVGLGTAGYMAPEQAMNARTVGKAADIWSMGATLYALLAGRSPFKGDTPVNTIVSSVQDPHEPMINVRPDVSLVTSTLLDRCLEKKAENRYVDGSSLLEALKICRDVLGAPEAVQKEALEAIAKLQKSAEKGERVAGVESPGKSFQAKAAAARAKTSNNKNTMMAVVAVVAVLVIGGVVALVMMKKPDTSASDEMKKQLLAQQQAMKDMEERMFKRMEDEKKQIDEERKKLKDDPERKAKEAAYDMLLAGAEMVNSGDLAAAEKNLGEAEKALQKDNPRVVSLRQAIEQKRKSLAEQDKDSKYRDAMTSVALLSTQVDKGQDLNEVESKFANAKKTYPTDPLVVALQEKIAKKRKDMAQGAEQAKAAKERTDAIKAFTQLVTAKNIAEAEKKQTELEAKYGSDPEFKLQKTELARIKNETASAAAADKMKAERAADLKAMEALVNDAAGDVADVEAKFSTVSEKYPGAAEFKALREKIEIRKRDLAQRAAEQQKRAQYDAALKEVAALLDKNELAVAEVKLGDAAKMGSGGALAELQQKLAAKKRAAADDQGRLARTQFDNNIRAAEELIKKGGEINFTKAEDSLKAAEKLMPNESSVANLRQKLAKARQEEKASPTTPPKKKRIGEEDL